MLQVIQRVTIAELRMPMHPFFFAELNRAVLTQYIHISCDENISNINTKQKNNEVPSCEILRRG
jgi:hypothetical protein